MDIGLGTLTAGWMLCGVVFWAGFASMGLRFRPLDEPSVLGSAPDRVDHRVDGARRPSDHVMARRFDP